MWLNYHWLKCNTYLAMQVIEAQPDMPIIGVVTLYSSLLKFTLHVHPDRLDYADQVLVYLLSRLLSHLHVLLFAFILFTCRSTSMDMPIDINGFYIFDELWTVYIFNGLFIILYFLKSILLIREHVSRNSLAKGRLKIIRQQSKLLHF